MIIVDMKSVAGIATTEMTGAVPRTRARPFDLLLIVAAIALWVSGLGSIDDSAMTDLGLPSVLPWTIWLSYGVVALGFALSLRPATVRGPLPFAHLVVLILILHATPAIAYETLRYSWAWKHIGVVDYIQRYGRVDTDAQFLAAYHSWPGFFFASATIADLLKLTPTGVADVVRFFPTALNLVFASLLPLVYRRLTDDPRLVWSGVAIFLVANWVGQDYFSPQGIAYAFYLALLALCLGPGALARPTLTAETRPTLITRLRSWVSRGEPNVSSVPARERLFATLAAFLLISVIVVTHQLTPILMILALGALVLLGRLSLGFLVFAVAAQGLWVFYFADVYVSSSFFDLLEDFGSVTEGATSKLVDYAVASEGQRIVSLISRALTGLIALAAVAGGIRRLLAGHRDAVAVALTVAPLPLLVTTPYGGEIIFRLYFYALPFFAFFAAALFFTRHRDPLPPAALARTFLALFLVVAAVGFVFANNGKDRQYRFTHDEVAAASWLFSHAPEGALIVEGARSYPSQFMNYERFTYLPLSEEHPLVSQTVITDPIGVLGRWLAQSAAGGYIIITDSQEAYIEEVGEMPPGALAEIKRQLLMSARFKVVFANADALIFALNEPTPGAREVVDD